MSHLWDKLHNYLNFNILCYPSVSHFCPTLSHFLDHLGQPKPLKISHLTHFYHKWDISPDLLLRFVHPSVNSGLWQLQSGGDLPAVFPLCGHYPNLGNLIRFSG